MTFGWKQNVGLNSVKLGFFYMTQLSQSRGNKNPCFRNPVASVSELTQPLMVFWIIIKLMLTNLLTLLSKKKRSGVVGMGPWEASLFEHLSPSVQLLASSLAIQPPTGSLPPQTLQVSTWRKGMRVTRSWIILTKGVGFFIKHALLNLAGAG